MLFLFFPVLSSSGTIQVVSCPVICEGSFLPILFAGWGQAYTFLSEFGLDAFFFLADAACHFVLFEVVELVVGVVVVGGCGEGL